MKGINIGRVVLGGLLAGLVMNIGEYILNVPILGAQWAAAMEARNVQEPASAVVGYVLMTFILGIGMVYLYAAIRPRYGPGVRTAICSGLFVWFFAWLCSFGSTIFSGILPANLVVISLIWGVVEVPLAAVAGAWVYKEEEPAAVTAGIAAA